MTVISTLLTADCIVHASDSYLTVVQKDGSLRVVESQRPKIIAVRYFCGAISFCGFAGYGGLRLVDWIYRKSQRAREFPSDRPDLFANWLASELDKWLQRVPGGRENRNRGVGLHFTVCESLPFGNVPELFWISNWDGAYKVLPNLTVQRQTIITMTRATELPKAVQPDHAERKRVYDFIRQPFQFLRYNNGDPELYVPQANAIVDAAHVLRRRKVLTKDRINYAGRLALMPVESVCAMQRYLSLPGTRAVGGRPHNLIIRPGRLYSSNTGLRLIPGA